MRLGAGVVALLFAFASFAQVGGPVAGAGQTYNANTPLPVTGGGTGASTAQGATTALAAPYILSKSAIAFIHISSGSIAANGALSGITALPSAYANAYCYLPANAVATVASAGWYFCQFSTTTAGTVYLNTYTTGVPTIPSSPTAVTDGKGAYTGDTSEQSAIIVTIPAAALGANGAVRAFMVGELNNSAGAKTFRGRFSGAAGTTYITTALTTTTGLTISAVLSNKGVTNAQYGVSYGQTFGGTNLINAASSAVDTTASTTFHFTLQKAVATDNAILSQHVFELLANGS